jgi:hypothetical protein
MFNEYSGQDVEARRYGLIGIYLEEMRTTEVCFGQFARYFDWVYNFAPPN